MHSVHGLASSTKGVIVFQSGVQEFKDCIAGVYPSCQIVVFMVFGVIRIFSNNLYLFNEVVY